MAFNQITQKYEGFIYLIENSINDKKYIGQTTTTIQHRWGQHITTRKNSGMLITKAIRKYGKENFSITELRKITADTKDQLIVLLNNSEVDYIKKYNSLSPNGYNLESGGKNAPSTLAKPIDVYTVNGEYIRSFDSCSESDKYYNLPTGTTSGCCNGKNLKAGKGKYTFRYKGDPFEKYIVNHYQRSKFVYKFDLNGNLLKKYPNITSAGNDIDTNNHQTASSCISSALDNPVKTAFGYYWSSDGDFKFDSTKYRNRTAVDQYSLDGQKINSYKSASDACNALNKSTGCTTLIINVCKGRSSQAFSYIWRFSGDPFDLFDIPIHFPKIKVDRYSTNGEFIATYNSYQDALLAIGRNIDQGNNIKKCCDGERPIVFGDVWRYHGEPFSKYPIYKVKKTHEKPVDQYTINGLFVKTYSSAKIAGKDVGLKNASPITQVCKGQRYSAKGYLWRYHGVPFDSFTVTPKKATKRKGQMINVYSIEDDYLYTAESSDELAQKYNCHRDTITNRCNGKIKNHIMNDVKLYYVSDLSQPDKTKIITKEDIQLKKVS